MNSSVILKSVLGSALKKFCHLHIKTHLLFSFILRLLIIIYGIYHDQFSSVPFTDIDYKVFTDASRHILEESSPYDRHTYRYSPLLAFLLIPNVLLHHAFGKIIFCIIDVGVGLLIRLIVIGNLASLKNDSDKTCFNVLFLQNEPHNPEKSKLSKVRQRKRSNKHNVSKKSKSNSSDNINSVIYDIADKSMLCWLYNPMIIVISTRGNCDSFSSFMVLYSLYFLQIEKRPFIAGLIHGLAIHFRIYPIIYSLSMFMFLSKFSHYTVKKEIKTKSETVESDNIVAKDNSEKSIVPSEKSQRKTIFKVEYLLYLIPNKDQLYLISGCFLSLISLTGMFYWMFGYQFLYETYLYHLIRVDFRHNFSLYFYLQYLTAWIRNIGIWQKILIVLPQIVLLLVFSVRYGLNKFSLNFAVLLNTIVFVIYNRVLTSQYFVWVMAILPLCIWQIRITKKRILLMLVIWFVAQTAWLLPAYLLEFQGENTFFFIWIQSVSFFCANIAILGRLIIHFMYENKK